MRCQGCTCVLASVLTSELEKLGLTFQSCRYHAKTILFEQGAHVDGGYIVCEGLIKQSLLVDSRRLLWRFVGSGQLIVEDVLSGCKVYRTQAEVLEDSQVLHIPRQSFLTLCSRFPHILEPVLRGLAGESFDVLTRLTAAAYSGMKEQLAALLWLLQERFGRDSAEGRVIALELSLQELAEMLGVSRQAASEAFHALEARGLVHRWGRWLLIPKLEGLRAQAGQFLG